MASQSLSYGNPSMTQRFAIYFAPARESALWRAAESWFMQPDLPPISVSARRYGFHATIKAPMALADGLDRTGLEMALAEFASRRTPVTVGRLAPTPIGGFLALTATPQPQALTDFAAEVVTAFEPFRAPMTAEDRSRRLGAPLTARQVELTDRYGYPYVLEEFLFHMTLTDRLEAGTLGAMRARAAAWFAEALGAPIVLDRLVLFHEAEPGAAFRRLDDHVLTGGAG
jgi:hypothetical protein